MKVLNALCIVLIFSGTLQAGGHLWDINELYSNSDGSIQFVELHVPMAAANENFMVNKYIRSNATGQEFTFPGNVVGNTAFKHLLIATAGFASLPGAPTPDYILPDNFLGLGTDTITWYVYDSWTYPTPSLPLDGVNSVQKDLSTGNLIIAANTPTNFADQTGTIDAGGPPPPPPPPVADFSVSLTSGDAPLTVSFTNLSSGDISDYLWDFGDGNSSTMSDPIHTYGSAGVYTVSLVATGPGGSDTATCSNCITATNPPPPPGINFIRGDANQDLSIDITDPISLLAYLFSGDSNSCTNALDANDDNSVDLSDAISLLNYLFGSAAAPAAPFPSCGSDPTTGGAVSCSSFNCP